MVAIVLGLVNIILMLIRDDATDFLLVLGFIAAFFLILIYLIYKIAHFIWCKCKKTDKKWKLHRYMEEMLFVSEFLIGTEIGKLIYYNTLLLDLLIEKDFGNLYATGLFQRYMDKIEGARFIRYIKNIFYDMIMDYCFAISEFSVKHYSVLVGKAINYINSNLENNLSVSEIANQLYVSPTYLSRAFKKETGFSIIEYINKLKIKHATFLLRDTALPIQDIGRIIGINDVNYFSRLFKRYMSQTPTQYRKIFN